GHALLGRPPHDSGGAGRAGQEGRVRTPRRRGGRAGRDRRLRPGSVLAHRVAADCRPGDEHRRCGMSRKDTITPSVVDAVREQTEQAAALAEIDGQDRLADPRLNPATRRRADELRTEQLTRALDAEHSRLLRRHRVADRHAAEAEETLQAIALARQAASPARSVLALHRGKRLYLRLSLAASLTLSAGSAMGVEAAARALNAPTGSGYIAEVGLTGLSTAVILYRAHL